MAAPVVHFEIHGKDGKQLQDFYSKLFSWKVDANNPMEYGMVQDSGIGGGITKGDASMVTVYVEVPDLQAALQKAESLGGKRVMGPEEIMGMVVLGQFTDPEGNLVGVVKDQSPEG